MAWPLSMVLILSLGMNQVAESVYYANDLQLVDEPPRIAEHMLPLLFIALILYFVLRSVY